MEIIVNQPESTKYQQFAQYLQKVGKGVGRLWFPNSQRSYSPLSDSEKAKISESRKGKQLITLTARIPKDLPPPKTVWSEGEVRNYHRVASIIFYSCRKFGFRSHDPVSIHSNDFAGIDEYRKYIDYMIAEEALSVDETYHFNQIDGSCQIEPRTKQYRLADRYLYQSSKDLIVFKFRTFRKTEEQLALSEPAKPRNPIEKLLEKILLEHTTVDQDFLGAGLLEIAYNWLERVNYGIAGVSQSENTGRLFSNVTFMNKEARSFILLDGEETVAIDFKSLHPYICYSFMTSDQEKEEWARICQKTGFYEWMMQSLGTTDRNWCKEVFQIYLAQKGEFRGMVSKFQEIMTKMFPAFDQYIRLHGSLSIPFQRILQQEESQLVIMRIFKVLSEHGIITLPVHDALIVKKSQAGELSEFMKLKALERWKIEVPVSVENGAVAG